MERQPAPLAIKGAGCLSSICSIVWKLCVFAEKVSVRNKPLRLSLSRRSERLHIPVKRHARSGGTACPFWNERRSHSEMNGVKRRYSVQIGQRPQIPKELRPLAHHWDYLSESRMLMPFISKRISHTNCACKKHQKNPPDPIYIQRK